MGNESPQDKAIKKSAEDTSFTPTTRTAVELPRDSDLFEAIMYRIEDDLQYTAPDWDKVKVISYKGRDDLLVNVYEVVEAQDGALEVFQEHRIRSFRAYVTGDDDQIPADQVVRVEST